MALLGIWRRSEISELSLPERGPSPSPSSSELLEMPRILMGSSLVANSRGMYSSLGSSMVFLLIVVPLRAT